MKTFSTFRFLPAVCLGLVASAVATYAESAPASLVERQAQLTKAMGTSAKAVVGIGAIGSGVITSKDGYILTAAHVVDAFMNPRTQEFAKETLPVLLADGKTVQAKILGRNRDRDAAMLKIVDPGEYPFVELGEADAVKEGDWCIAMGHPGGYQRDRTAPVRLGRVWDRDAKRFFRSDCTVSGGDSGGPLFSMDGKLIGIHSNIGERLDENRHVPIGAFKESWDRLAKGDTWGDLGKVIPELRQLDRGQGRDRQDREETPKEKPRAEEKPPQPKPEKMEEKRAEPKVEENSSRPPAPLAGKATLGVQLDFTEAPTVAKVDPETPAGKAGIQPGDVIQSFAGDKITSVSELLEGLSRQRPGAKVKVGVLRGSDSKELEVTLGAK